jgi:hypothetical protein
MDGILTPLVTCIHGAHLSSIGPTCHPLLFFFFFLHTFNLLPPHCIPRTLPQTPPPTPTVAASRRRLAVHRPPPSLLRLEPQRPRRRTALQAATPRVAAHPPFASSSSWSLSLQCWPVELELGACSSLVDRRSSARIAPLTAAHPCHTAGHILPWLRHRSPFAPAPPASNLIKLGHP